MSVDHIHVRVTGEEVRHMVKGAGQQEIIGVQIGHHFARRVLKPKIDGMGLAVILTAIAAGKHGSIALQDVDGVVCRETILDNILQPAILLAQYTLNRAPEEIALVKGWGDDGNRDRCEARPGGGMGGGCSGWSGRVLFKDPEADAEALP